MISHTLLKFDPSSGSLSEALYKEYEEKRRDPKRPVKDRSRESLYKCRVATFTDPISLDSHPYLFLLSREQDSAKGIAYRGWVTSPASAGTSQFNTLCITDGMQSCIAVAIGGEKKHRNGSNETGAKIRVFHVYPLNVKVAETIRTYIKRLQQSGLTVKVAMHGGESDFAPSREKAEELRYLLRDLKVKIEFDETCEKRTTDTPLGVVIKKDNRVQFVTKVCAPVGTDGRLLPAAMRPALMPVDRTNPYPLDLDVAQSGRNAYDTGQEVYVLPQSHGAGHSRGDSTPGSRRTRYH